MRVVSLAFFGLISVSAFAQWKAVEDYPGSPNDGCISAVVGDRAYVGGGTGRADFYMYDPFMDQWTSKSAIPGSVARAWSGCFVANDNVYVVAGAKTFTDLLDDMWMYDTKTEKWEKKASFLGGKRDGPLVMAFGDKVYVGGGFDGQYIRPDFYRYNVSTDDWDTLADLPAAMIFPASFVIGDKGYCTFFEGGGFFSDLLVFDSKTETWTEKAACPGPPRAEGIGFQVGGFGYAGLGQTGFNKTYTDMYRYDPNADQWQKMTDTFPVISSAWSSAFVIGYTAFAGMGTDLPDFNFSNKFFRYEFAPLSYGKINDESMRIYPNPSNSQITIHSVPDLESELEIIDMKGSVKMRTKYRSGESLSIAGLEAGVYFVKIYAEEHNFTSRLIKVQ